MTGNDKPLVSVIMPAYRSAPTIAASVESVLAQKEQLELLIVDDCSDDDLDAALAPFATDARVKLLRNACNCGAAESRNRGVAAASGAYVAFCDADDIWADGKLEKQLVKIEETGAVLCATARELMKPDGTLTGRVIGVKERITYRDILRHNCINCSSVLLRADAARQFPFAHEDSHEDYILWMRLLREYGAACAVNEPLLKYRMSSTGKSGSKLRSAKKTYTAYRYAGFGVPTSIALFVSYALHGAAKYAHSYLGGTQ